MGLGQGGHVVQQHLLGPESVVLTVHGASSSTVRLFLFAGGVGMLIILETVESAALQTVDTSSAVWTVHGDGGTGHLLH